MRLRMIGRIFCVDLNTEKYIMCILKLKEIDSSGHRMKNKPNNLIYKGQKK